MILITRCICTGTQLDTRLRELLKKAADDYLLIKSAHVKTTTVAQMRNETWEGGIDFDTSSSEEDDDAEGDGRQSPSDGKGDHSHSPGKPQGRRPSVSITLSPSEPPNNPNSKPNATGVSEKLAERRKARAHLSVGGLKWG